MTENNIRLLMPSMQTPHQRPYKFQSENTCNKLGKTFFSSHCIFYMSLMASDEFEEYVKDPKKLSQFLHDHIEEMGRALDDDEEFCKKDIDSTMQYLKEMEKKFVQKFREMEKKLDDLRKENEEKSEENRQILYRHNDEIQHLTDAKKYEEGLL